MLCMRYVFALICACGRCDLGGLRRSWGLARAGFSKCANWGLWEPGCLGGHNEPVRFSSSARRQVRAVPALGPEQSVAASCPPHRLSLRGLYLQPAQHMCHPVAPAVRRPSPTALHASLRRSNGRGGEETEDTATSSCSEGDCSSASADDCSGDAQGGAGRRCSSATAGEEDSLNTPGSAQRGQRAPSEAFSFGMPVAPCSLEVEVMMPGWGAASEPACATA